MNATGRVCMIVNPTAGSAKQRKLDQTVQRLNARKVDLVVRETTQRGDAEDLARAAAREPDIRAVIAAGGDGTINEVTNGLVEGRGLNPGPALGIVPLGTANVLAAELGLSLDPVTAGDVIAAGKTRTIQLGRCNDRLFLMMAGVGFDARVVAAVKPAMKRLLGKTTYVWESLVEMARLGDTRYQVTIDGQTHDAASAILANGHFYAGRFVAAPDARLDQPDLHACLFPGGSRLDAMRYSAALVLDRLQRQADVQVIAGSEILVNGPSGEPVQGDGDIIASLPARITAGAATLPILVP